MKRNITKLIGIVVFVIILSRIDTNNLLVILKEISLFHFCLAVSLVFPLGLLKAIRWKLLMVDQKLIPSSFSLYEIFKVYFIGAFFGVVTPGRVGDLVKIKYLKSMNYSYSESAVSVLLDRILDVFALFLICISMSAIYYKYTNNTLLFFNLVLIVAIFFSFFLVRGIKGEKLQSMDSKWINNQFIKKVIKSLAEIAEGVKTISFKSLLICLVITFAGWYIYFLRAFWIVKSIGLSISFSYLVFCISVSAFITFIPITYFGLGTRDLVIIHLFSIINISKEYAVAFSTLIFFSILLGSLVGLIIYLHRKEGLSYKGITCSE